MAYENDENKNKQSQYSKTYYLKNKEKIKNRMKKYYDNNKEVIISNWKNIYYKNNKKTIQAQRKKNKICNVSIERNIRVTF